MKDRLPVVGLTVVVAIAIIAGIIVLSKNDVSPQGKSENTNQVALYEEYPDLPKNNNFTRQPAANIIETLESGTGLVFLGFKECPWCQKLAPIVNQAASDTNSTVYYLDIRQLRQDNSPEYQKLASILSEHLPVGENGQPVITVPDVSIVKNGDIVWRYQNEKVSSEESTPNAYWTDERRQRALDEISKQLKSIGEDT